MTARLFKPSKTAMQSGKAKTQAWVLEFRKVEALSIDSCMHWNSSDDTQSQVRLSFPTKEDGIAYATKHGLAYTVTEPKESVIRPKNYADNFVKKV